MSTAAQARAAILQRLQSAPTFHPSSADLFADWGNQPGDIVTLRSGDNSYSVPIYGMRTRWAGSTRVEVTATGNKKRAGIAEASKKEYSRRGGGYYGQQFLHREFVSEDGTLRSLLEMTASYLRTEFADDVNGLRSNLEMTASYLRTEFNQSADGLHSEIVQTASYIRATMDADKEGLHSEIVQTASYWRAALEDTANGLSSRIEQTASYWRANLNDAVNSMRSEVEQTASYWRATLTDEISSLHSEVEQTASSWRASIESVVGSDGRVTAATIAVAINAQGSSALIAADRVQISGNTTLSGALTVDGDGKLCVSRVMAIGSGYLTTINGDKVTTKDVQINSSGKLIFVGSDTGEHYDVDVATLKNCIKSASVDNNVLTLTPFYGDPITFSKATTLSGIWSGTTLTVTANPALASPLTKTIIHQVEGTGISIFASHVYKDSTSDSANRISSVSLYMEEDVSNKKVDVHKDAADGTVVGSVSTSDTYDAGFDAVTSSGMNWGSTTGASSNTVSVSVSAKTNGTSRSKSETLHLTVGTWSNGFIPVYVRKTSISGDQVMENSVSMPSITGTNWVNTSGDIYRADVTIGGVTRPSGTKDFGSLRTAGYNSFKTAIHHITFDSAKNHVGNYWNCNIYNSSNQLLRFLETDQQSSGLILATASPTITANGTYYPHGFDADIFSHVVVNVPSGGGGEQHTNSVTLTYDGMQNVSQGGQSIFQFNYHYTRNTASPRFTNQTVWW